jgi:hypothetical protein
VTFKKEREFNSDLFYVILYCGSGTGSLDRTFSRDSTLFCVPAGPAHWRPRSQRYSCHPTCSPHAETEPISCPPQEASDCAALDEPLVLGETRPTTLLFADPPTTQLLKVKIAHLGISRGSGAPCSTARLQNYARPARDGTEQFGSGMHCKHTRANLSRPGELVPNDERFRSPTAHFEWGNIRIQTSKAKLSTEIAEPGSENNNHSIVRFYPP